MSPDLQTPLELAVVGNCEVAALIDRQGRLVWMCLPRPDGDPVFSALLTRELVEALLVNPYDVSETAVAILAALDMPREQRRKRMQLMRRTVSESNVYRWAGRMLMDVAGIRQRQALSNWMTNE